MPQNMLLKISSYLDILNWVLSGSKKIQEIYRHTYLQLEITVIIDLINKDLALNLEKSHNNK